MNETTVRPPIPGTPGAEFHPMDITSYDDSHLSTIKQFHDGMAEEHMGKSMKAENPAAKLAHHETSSYHRARSDSMALEMIRRAGNKGK